MNSCSNWRGLFSAWCRSKFLGHLLARLASCYWWWVWVLGFLISPIRALLSAFCAFKCGLLFELWSFLFSSLVPLLGAFPLYIYLSILFVVLRSPSSHAVALGFKRRPTFIHEVGVTDYNADAKEKISSLRSSFSFARREGGREEDDDSAKKETHRQ
jgi:hypothetical protein